MFVLVNDEKKKKKYEGGVVRMIMGSKKTWDGEYRRQKNGEVDDFLDGKDVLRVIKAQRLRMFGHVKR